ncbi:MAG: hypothetical protein H0V63_07105 [Burkholderiaceae bacterium]|nr:hypothetical protein [Burkholderiaceae bacterium]
MALSTYAELQTSVATFMRRSDLTTLIPDYIALAEAEINRRVRVRAAMDTTTLSLAAAGYSVALPAGFLEEIELNYVDGTYSLMRAPWAVIDASRVTAQVTGRPGQYGVTDSTIEFDFVADAAYSLKLRYYKRWSLATDLTNWLLTNHPDVYLFGAIHEAALHLVDADVATFAKAKRDAALESLLLSDGRNRGHSRRTDLPIPSSYNITRGY